MNVLVACAGDERDRGGLFALSSVMTATRATRSDPPVDGLACVVRHPFLPTAYSVAGRGAGVLHAWSTDGSLRLLSTQPTHGEEPCHIAVHPSGRALIVVNYESGTLFTVAVDANGLPAQDGRTLQLEGGGPVRGRQDSAHPHQALFTSEGGPVLVPDLGADLLRSFALDIQDAALAPISTSRLPPGTGPRHAVLLDTGVVVLTGELSQTVVAGRLDRLTGSVDSWRATSSTRLPATKPNYPGDVVAHPDAGVVYAANRGADTVVVLRVDGDRLVFVEERAAGVRWPQHLAFVEGALVIAGRDSSEVVALRTVDALGRLSQPTPVAHLPGPVWLAAGPGEG